MELWHAWTCPYCMRVRAALAEKGIPYAEREVDLGRKPQELLALNPVGGVPVLVAEGTSISDSGTILRYLEERYPDPPLLPRDASGRDHAWALHDRATALIAPLLPPLLRGSPPEKEQAGTAIRSALASLEEEAPENGFLVGAFSVADLALASLVLKLPGALRPSGLGLPRLSRWEAASLARPGVSQSSDVTISRPGRPIEVRGVERGMASHPA